MKLRPVDTKSNQNYPDFDDYWQNRRHYIKEAALCAGLVIGSGIMTSCTQQKPHVMGEMVAPQAPTHQSKNGNAPSSIKPPVEEAPSVEGRIAAPHHPGSEGANERPPFPGGMPAPRNVESPKTQTPPLAEEPPDISGDIVAPIKPPPPSEDIRMRGEMAVPKPPDAKK